MPYARHCLSRGCGGQARRLLIGPKTGWDRCREPRVRTHYSCTDSLTDFVREKDQLSRKSGAISIRWDASHAENPSNPSGVNFTSIQRRGPFGHRTTRPARPNPLNFREIDADGAGLVGPDPSPKRLFPPRNGQVWNWRLLPARTLRTWP